MEETILSCWFDGYNRRDWETVKGIYANDAIIHGKEGLLRGGQAVVELAQKWLEALPDSQISPLHTSREGDVVVVHWKAEGTFEQPIGDIAATGQKVVFHGLTCFRCQEQQVVEHWASVDYQSLMLSKQAGTL